MTTSRSTHSALHLGGRPAADATAAVERLVEELQAGWDRHDADVTDNHLAGDVLWGSPFGMTVSGYEDLHAIHVRLKREGAGGQRSRFEIVNVLAPAPDVAVAQVRRVALDSSDESDAGGSFSEMALYVLVRREGTWWLAAGQNTPIPEPATLSG